MEVWNGEFSQATDITYGLICVSCSFVGILGNIFSFFFFKAKKRDISTVIYMLITGCDIVISILVLPVGISLLSQRNPGLIFGNTYSCTVWAYMWNTAVTLSFFLVICLSVTRTISLFQPFKQLNAWKLCISVLVYIVVSLGHSLWYYLKGSFVVDFSLKSSKCNLLVLSTDGGRLDPIALLRGISYVAPIFVVAVSCVISVILLTRKNEDIQQRELQQSRNRATITILLFALLYIIQCNIFYTLHIVIFTIQFHGINWNWLFYNLSKFDVYGYYFTAVSTLLIAANSAVNPLLYLWRMHRLREYILAELRKYFKILRGLFRFNRVTMESEQDAAVVDM